MIRAILVACLLGAAVAEQYKAVAHLKGPSAHGNVTFTQDSSGGPVHVVGTLLGLAPGKHGFHIHEKGDITGGCATTAGHFNPDNHKHGAPEDSDRHAGDLGNIVVDQSGVANIDITDNIISLQGEKCIIGRGIVVHTGEDDLGRTSHPDSRTTGNAGGRAACGVIGIA